MLVEILTYVFPKDSKKLFTHRERTAFNYEIIKYARKRINSKLFNTEFFIRLCLYQFTNLR